MEVVPGEPKPSEPEKVGVAAKAESSTEEEADEPAPESDVPDEPAPE